MKTVDYLSLKADILELETKLQQLTDILNGACKITIISDTDGVLTNNKVTVNEDGVESLTFNKKDGWLLKQCAEENIQVIICTLDPKPACSRERTVKLGLEHVATTSAQGKHNLVMEHKKLGEYVVYIGDAPQDALAMQVADEAWAPADGTVDTTLKHVHYTKAAGGEGVLYEVCKSVLNRFTSIKSIDSAARMYTNANVAGWTGYADRDGKTVFFHKDGSAWLFDPMTDSLTRVLPALILDSRERERRWHADTRMR